MSNSDQGGTPFEDDGMVRKVRDPDGHEFVIQAAPATGTAGPVRVGRITSSSDRGPVFRLVNRLLARVQQPIYIDSVMVSVYQLTDDEPIDLLIEEARTMADARSMVSSIAQNVERGNFP